MPNGVSSVLRWFRDIGHAMYWRTYLQPGWDLYRLKHDPGYGLKHYLQYTGTRQGAPRASVIAGIKAISMCERHNRPFTEIPQYFHAFYNGQIRASHSPALDPRLANVNVPALITMVGAGNLAGAFNNLRVNGAGHKVRALFLRDVVCLLSLPTQGWDTYQYLYCQPIDVWVEMMANEIIQHLGPPAPTPSGTISRYGGLSGDQVNCAVAMIEQSTAAGLSPLEVNQGVWYFASNVVADERRLRQLLAQWNAQVLANELALVNSFLP